MSTSSKVSQSDIKTYQVVTDTGHFALFFFLVTICSIVLWLRPGWLEGLLTILLDMFLVQGFTKIDRKVLDQHFPAFKKLNNFLNRQQDQEQESFKVELIQHIFSLPRDNMNYITLIGIVKNFFLIGPLVVFWWEHPGLTNFEQALRYIMLQVLTLTFFHSISYIQGHRHYSEVIRNLHEKCDFSSSFIKVHYPFRSLDFLRFEKNSLFSLGAIILVLFGVITMTEHSGGIRFNLSCIWVFVIGFMAMFRTYIVYKSFLVEGLDNIFAKIDSIGEFKSGSVIPLNSHSYLGGFQQIYNDQMLKLKERESQLSKWMFYELEQSRSRTIGELASLVAHDLTGPVMGISYSVDQLEELKTDESELSYLGNIRENVARVDQLVNSMRSFLKNENVNEIVKFQVVHNYVLKLLGVEYSSANFSSLSIELSEDLKKIEFETVRVLFGQILHNLYRNSIKNLVDHKVEGPRIEIGLVEDSEDFIEFYIADNGTGLTKDEFEELTSLDFILKSDKITRSGLGLRLTRRLVETLGGKIYLGEGAETGTKIVILFHKSHTLL